MTTNVAAPAAPAAASTPAAAPTQGQGQGADPAPATQAGAKPTRADPEEQAAPPKTWDVKVNGKTVKLTEEEMIERARLSEAAQQRFNEAAQLRRQAEAALGRIRDPESMMEALLDPALGLSKDEIRARFESWYEREFIEPEKLTEDQRKLRDAEAKIKKYAEDEKQREEAKRQAEQEELTQRAREEIQGQIIEALESGKLPRTNFTVKRLAYWIQRNQANGFNAPTSLLVSQVKNEFNASIRDMVEASDGEALIQILGDSIVQKIRKFDLEQLRRLRGAGTQPVEQSTAPTETRREHPPSSADVTAKLRELQRTGRY